MAEPDKNQAPATAFTDIAKKRRSYKIAFNPDHLSVDTIRNLLDIARWAPSAHNAQPWRFVVFFNNEPSHQEIRNALLNAMAKKFQKDLVDSGKEENDAKSISGASNKKFHDAPVLLLAFVEMRVMDQYDDERANAEFIMATQSLAAALQTLLLAIESAGYKACWYCAPLFAEDVISNTLGVPSSWHPQAFITLGKGLQNARGIADPVPRTDSRTQGSTRLPVSEILFLPTNFWTNRRDRQG